MLVAPAHPLKKGDEGPEVRALYYYLRRLGYAVHAPRRVDRYDEALTQAVVLYQEFFGLGVDGELGEKTLDRMRARRCGVPDLLPGSRSLPRAVPTTRAWPRTDLTYGFIRFTRDLNQGQVAAAVSQAFATWAAVTPLTFRAVPPSMTAAAGVQALSLVVGLGRPAFDGRQAQIVQLLARHYAADILIGFLVREHGDPPALLGAPPFDDNPQVAGHAFPPPAADPAIFAGDVHFNDAVKWTVKPGVQNDLVAVATHEIGHALGLGHPRDEPDSIMTEGRAGRDLAPVDIEAIQSLYGPPR